MELWAMGTVLVLAIGIVLIGIGWRGRRIDDHPLCRRCGFDLTGRAPDSTRCAECGADVTRPHAIRTGHRRRRGGMLLGGAALALPALLVVSVVVFVQARGVDLTPYKPGWWLVRESAANGPAANVALAELSRRVQAGTLADHHVVAVADQCLANQANTAITWRPEWGRFVEAAQAAGKLAREKWGKYAEQAFAPRLLVRPTVRRGDPVPVAAENAAPRLGAATFVALWNWDDLRIDGEPVGLPRDANDVGVNGSGYDGRFEARGNGWGASYYHPRVDGKRIGALTSGKHRYEVRLKLRIFEQRDVAELSDGGRVSIDPARQLGTVNADLGTPFHVYEPAAAPSEVFHDESIRPKVESAIKVRYVRPRGKQVELSIEFVEPPARLAYIAGVRPVGSTKEIKFSMCYANKSSNNGFTYAETGSLGDARSVIVTLRPDLKFARESVDATPIWGGEVVKEVPVSAEETSSP